MGQLLFKKLARILLLGEAVSKKAFSTSVTVRGKEARIRPVYLSITNSIEVRILTKSKKNLAGNARNFLFQYEGTVG